MNWDVFTPKDSLQSILALENFVEKQAPIAMMLQYAAPFISIFIAGVIYYIPLLLAKDSPKNLNIIIKRILDLPAFSFLVTLSGWGVSAGIQLITFFSFKIEAEIFYVVILIRGIVPLLTGLLIGILVYYSVDFMNQIWIIPQYFSSGEILQVKKTSRFSIRSRFFIFLLATSTLPLIFLNVMTLSLTNEYKTTLFYSLFFLFIAVLITLFLSRTFKDPLTRMDLATHAIQNGNYDEKIDVLTEDELGRLANSLNTMSQGLKERDSIKETFGRVVDPSVRDHLLNGNINLGGEYYTATVLFTDIRNFTTISEQLPADKLVEMLNRYFSVITSAIIEEGGLVNKFIGDAVLALFGVPIVNETHAQQAIRAAEKILLGQDKLNQQFKRENLPQMKSGIGIHTGQLIAGNIGSDARMEFTAIGDTVNVAARLESSSKKIGKDLIFSEETRNAHPDSERFKRLGTIRVKGRTEKLTIYTI
ncbi:MAG: HAMP domain-containing protein [Spirochaetaceae bacterium]|nr:HAMP domain-containing protein [Spirochaetaceae bacterium]